LRGQTSVQGASRIAKTLPAASRHHESALGGADHVEAATVVLVKQQQSHYAGSTTCRVAMLSPRSGIRVPECRSPARRHPRIGARLSPVPELTLPYPPLGLANRVGSLEGATKPIDFYDQLGRHTRREIVDGLPPDWSFAGRRILDFGCGAGRTLRHFAAEATEAEVWGCDIDERSIAWLTKHLCPPFHAFLNGPEPPLNQPSASFDLIWGISVFTHLTDSWSRWLVELHRLLTPNGLLYLTFMGSGMSESIVNEPWDDRRFGMNVFRYGQSWDLGGPMVIHSPWWIEEHWGRAFEILSLLPAGFASEPSVGHGSVLMRKRDQPVTAEMLEQIRPGDTRETLALAHAVRQAYAELATLRDDGGHVNSLLAESLTQKQAAEAQVADLEGRLSTIEGSRSWNLTRPLRSITQRLRVARH